MAVAESLGRFFLLSGMEPSSHGALGSLPTAVLKTSGFGVAMCSSTGPHLGRLHPVQRGAPVIGERRGWMPGPSNAGPGRS